MRPTQIDGYSPASFQNPVPPHFGKPGEPCKDSYIGAPVKAIANACQYCHGKGCPHCSHKGHKCGPQGVCAVVVDDANNKVYLYGNIIHENYHVPGNQCVAYTTVAGTGFEGTGRAYADQYYVGEQDNNNIVLPNTPLNNERFMVFLNGLKQRQGGEYDFIVEDNKIHFNFYDLLATDTVEVMYEYLTEE